MESECSLSQSQEPSTHPISPRPILVLCTPMSSLSALSVCLWRRNLAARRGCLLLWQEATSQDVHHFHFLSRKARKPNGLVLTRLCPIIVGTRPICQSYSGLAFHAWFSLRQNVQFLHYTVLWWQDVSGWYNRSLYMGILYRGTNAYHPHAVQPGRIYTHCIRWHIETEVPYLCLLILFMTDISERINYDVIVNVA
jgi:hypothetical protein